MTADRRDDRAAPAAAQVRRRARPVAGRARQRRWLAIGATALVGTALVGWMHTPAARPWLARLGVPCPIDTTSVAQVEAVRSQGLALWQQRDGGAARASAPSRPALGLVLDRTDTAEATRWLAAEGSRCERIDRGLPALRCRGVPAAALGLDGPPVSELWLSFGASGRLIGVDVYRRGLAADDARGAWTHAVEALQQTLGAPTRAQGDASPEALQTAALKTAQVEYRYADYVATVTAAHLPQAGLAVRERYLSTTR